MNIFLRYLISPHEVNLWRVPLLLSLIATVLFGATVGIDSLNAQGVIHLPAWMSNGGIDDARSILSSEMGAVSTVLALIFSVALLVLSMVASLFGFRLLYRFVQDWVTQVTIGLFLATFIYILLAYVATRSDSHGVFVPQLTLLTASILVVVSFGLLVYYSHRIAVSIQNPDMIATIVLDMKMASQVMHKSDRGNKGTTIASLSENGEGGLIHSLRTGYLQHLNHLAMVEAATQTNAQIEVMFRPGQFIQSGEVLAKVFPEAALPAVTQLVTQAVSIGSHRVLIQDPEFGLYQIVEIGIRALSPAVNDTFTGIACVDCIGDALRILLMAPPYDGCWYDKSGQLRVKEPQVKCERLIKAAFEQIRQASVDNPAVLIRILTTMKRLTDLLRTDVQRQAMLDQAAAIWEASSTGSLVTIDQKDVEIAWGQTLAALHRQG